MTDLLCSSTNMAAMTQREANDVRNVQSNYTRFLAENTNIFFLVETNSSRVRLLLSKLCKAKATGLDNISAKLLSP